MAILDTDLLLINRAGASYKVAASDLVDKVQAGDLALVNRSGDSYKLTGTNLTAGTFNDTDLFLINRAGASYQVAGSEIKTLLTPPVPPIIDATWTFAGKNSNGSNFRLTVTFATGTALDFSQPTVAPLTLVCRKDSSFASLIAPITNVGGPVYETKTWSNSNTATEQIISPSFGSSASFNKLSFDLFVPNNITWGGSSASAKGSPINGTWTGTVGVYQNGIGQTTVMSQFTADNDYFN